MQADNSLTPRVTRPNYTDSTLLELPSALHRKKEGHKRKEKKTGRERKKEGMKRSGRNNAEDIEKEMKKSGKALRGKSTVLREDSERL